MGIYTQRPEPEVDEMVQQHMQTAVRGILKLAPTAMAIYLSGGFGRGEGTVRRANTHWIPVNDYDFVVVNPTDGLRPMGASDLGRTLATRFGVDYVDIGWLTLDALRTARPTLENYDFRQVARLVHGTELRAEMPEIAVSQIPEFEYTRLICNRAAGLNTIRLQAHAGNKEYAFSQGLKAWQAVGDVLVGTIEGYSPRTAERLASFRRICGGSSRPGWLGDQEVSHVSAAYTLKLRGWTDQDVAGQGAPSAAAALGDVFRWLLTVDGGFEGDDMQNAISAARKKYGGQRRGSWRNLGRAVKRMHPGYLVGDMAWLGLHVLLAQLAVATASDLGASAERREYLRQFWWVPGGWRQRFDASGAVHLWEKFCHG